MQIEGQPPEPIEIEVSCVDCGHIPVCVIFRAVGPLLQKWEDPEKRPFEPETLALICRHRVSRHLIETLQNGGENL